MMKHNAMMATSTQTQTNNFAPTSSFSSDHMFACPHEAYNHWKDISSHVHMQKRDPSINKILSRSKNIAILGLEAKDSFQRMKVHYQMFGHLTNATLDGFVRSVLIPNQVSVDHDQTILVQGQSITCDIST